MFVAESPEPDRHALLTYRSQVSQRERTLAWIKDSLARGDKVVYRAVPPAGLADELGAVGRTASKTGQLEIVDAQRSFLETDGGHRSLRELHENLVRAAFDDGYRAVALAADAGALRVMAPEPAERLAHEHDLERLASLAGVRILCCHDLRAEQPDVLEALAGLHFRWTDDVLWSARLSGGRLLVRGEIDADNAGRFGATLRGAVAHGVRTVDLGGVTVFSASALRVFDDTVALIQNLDERLRLVNLRPTVHQVISTLRLTGEQAFEVVEGAVTDTDTLGSSPAAP